MVTGGGGREPGRGSQPASGSAWRGDHRGAWPYRIRAAGAADLLRLQDIERAAGRCFRDIGMPQVADDEPLPVDVLADYQRAGRAWVAVTSADTAVGYLITDLVDGNVHIEQVSVHPDHARRRIGRSLIDRTAVEAADDGVRALTLTAFRDVPWNAPYYARCGFHPLDEQDVTAGLRAIRAREAAHGMDQWPRICMRRELPGVAAT